MGWVLLHPLQQAPHNELTKKKFVADMSSRSFWECKLRELVASRDDPRTVDTLLRQTAKQIADLDAPKPVIHMKAVQPKQWWAGWDDSDGLAVAWAMMTPTAGEGRRWRIDVTPRKFYLVSTKDKHVWAQVVEAVESRDATALRAAWELARSSLQIFAKSSYMSSRPWSDDVNKH
jgi:hypothetical protein